jgi:hypothetical protein
MRMLIKSALISAAVALAATLALFALNLTIELVGPAHYRQVVSQAIANGIFNEKYHWLLGPYDRTMPIFGGNDCLIASMLAAPIESRLKTAVSPRVPAAENFCAGLTALVSATPIQFRYYHRYLHGDRTVAGLLLAIIPLGIAMQTLRIVCYGLLAVVFVIALARRRGGGEKAYRFDALLILAATFALFYGLPQFGQLFSFAPTDIVLLGFLLFATLRPLPKLSEGSLTVAVAAFGSAIAALEFLTGGIPIAATLLMLLIVLDHSGDARSVGRTVLIACTSFGTAVATCFIVVLLVIWTVWGTPEVVDFFQTLLRHVEGSVSTAVPPALVQWLAAHGIGIAVVDHSYLARLLLEGTMLTYSAFIIGWGSHILGAALVLLPPWYLLFRAARAVWAGGKWAERREVKFAAVGLIPVTWYLVFTFHTVLHSSYMVRPLTLNVALAAIVLLLVPMRSKTAARAPATAEAAPER